jgi:hypothetical protein
MRRVCDTGEPGQLVIAGDGREMSALRRLVRQLGLAHRVQFAGRVTEAAKRTLMERAWIHAITSMKEGWGITVMEAAACGTPTIASDSPGLRDAVVHGETGTLVRHRDVTALADAMRALFSNRAELERLATAARARAEGFTWDASAQAVEQHLQSMAASERPALAGAWARFRQSPPSQRLVSRAREPVSRRLAQRAGSCRRLEPTGWPWPGSPLARRTGAGVTSSRPSACCNGARRTRRPVRQPLETRARTR